MHSRQQAAMHSRLTVKVCVQGSVLPARLAPNACGLDFGAY